MNDEQMRAAVRRMEEIFGAIKTAAMVLGAIEPQKLLDSWNHQEAILPFTDPTLMQSLLSERDDMDRKKRLLTAARDFMGVWNRVKAESLAADAVKAAAKAPPPGNEEAS